MDKLVEREAPPRPLAAAPALAVQFFLIPLAVVAVLVLVYAGFRMLIADQRSAQDYLNDIRVGGRDRRWPAAYELSRLLADPSVEAGDPDLGRALVRAFKESKDDDPRVRRYLGLAIGRLKAPPPDTIPTLLEATGDPEAETAISAIWALGSLGRPEVVPALQPLYGSPDPGVRKVVVYALGALPGDAQLETLRAALQDAVPDVQWNAAIGLARHGDASGVAVLRRMLDREYVERAVTRPARLDADEDPVADVMIGSLRAIAALGEGSLRSSVESLSRDDRSLRVRQAAMETLERIGVDRPQG
jgi:HEAT repeat protein